MPVFTRVSISVFPAYAGMFRLLSSSYPGPRGFPRVCGDVPRACSQILVLELFSPRMRGCSGCAAPVGTCVGVFSAYAGMFRSEVTSNIHTCGFPAHAGMLAWGEGRVWGDGWFSRARGDVPEIPPPVCRSRFPRIRGDIPEARPAMRKILLKNLVNKEAYSASRLSTLVTT